jgi:hypothetical protein
MKGVLGRKKNGDHISKKNAGEDRGRGIGDWAWRGRKV